VPPRRATPATRANAHLPGNTPGGAAALPALPLAVALAASAGFVDAVGYLHFAHVFVSFMSGNSTILGIAVGQAKWPQAISPLLAIAFFVLGSFIGSLLRGSTGAWRVPAILAFEAAVLVVALALPDIGGELAPALVLLASAMGAQNAVMRDVGGVRVSLTYVTGALVNLGQSLAEAVLRRDTPSGWHVHAVMWIGLIAGGIGGGFAYLHVGFDALVVPTAALVALGVLEGALVLRGRGPAPL
jgi:uncharacterized membrane protein YoaK (UPF0700 family)